MESIQKYITEFKILFEGPSEVINQKYNFMVNITRKSALEKVTESIRLEVDQMVSSENSKLKNYSFKSKKRLINTKENLLHTLQYTFRIAKNYQPAIIYLDNAKQIFTAKAKGANKNSTAQKMKKYIASL